MSIASPQALLVVHLVTDVQTDRLTQVLRKAEFIQLVGDVKNALITANIA
jgi:hypothetical protein